MNFLGNLAPTVPGFAGGQFPIGQSPVQGSPMLPDMMAPINEAFAANQAQAQAKPRGGMFRQGGTFSNVLGAIGDALLVHSGRQPVYGPAMQRKKMGEALSNYLGQMGGVDPALAQVLQQDPGTGLELFKMSRPSPANDPETIRLMRAAGIDPASEEGRAIIQQKLSGGGQADPNFVRELEALGIDPRSDEALELYYGRNSPAGYLLKPRSRDGSSESLPAVNSQAEYDALPAGTRYRDSQGNVGVKRGGPTATPSEGFR